MTDLLRVRVLMTARHCIIHCYGEIDDSSAPELRATIDHLITSGTRRLIMDLDAVSFMGSSGLNTLVHVVNKLGPGSVSVVVRNPHIRRLFSITALDHVFPLYDSIGAAVHAAPEDIQPC